MSPIFFTGHLTLTGGHVPPPILKIEPGDVIVAQSPIDLNKEEMTRIQHGLKALFPDHGIAVFANGLHLAVSRADPSEHSQSLPDPAPIDEGSGYSEEGSGSPADSSSS